jgi:transcriptional activator of cad operon
MEHPTSTKLRIGEWCVSPESRQISKNGEATRLEERAMRLLLCLAERPGEVVSIDDLLSQVWSGVIVSSDSVYQAVASLRRQLGDDPKQPSYIATVPRLGYRMVAKVDAWNEFSSPIATAPKRPHFLRAGIAQAIAVVVCISLLTVLIYFIAFRSHRGAAAEKSTLSAAVPQKSIAVLPFLDLTKGMREEEFADGMTEELIDKLSKIPGLQVPAPTSSFVFKNKQVPVADIAKTLGVVYVLDGSVRKSGTRLRVAARLVRADSGYVIWSETYDRPFNDALMVQDNIASEVTKALRASIESKPEQDKVQR